VDAPVGDEVGFLSEALPTLRADKRGVLGVTPGLGTQLGFAGGAVPLLSPSQGLVAGGVDALVGQQVGLLAEALATLGAGERPLARVDAAVGDEVGALAEALPAVPAAIGLLPGVDPLVGDQALLLPEALPALGA
ncbi:hypothetical protein M959_05722, partial [Chaetura pelagica]